MVVMKRRTFRMRGKISSTIYVPSRGTVRVVCKPAAEGARADISVRFQAKQLQMLRERDQREFELPENVLARKLRAMHESKMRELRAEKRKQLAAERKQHAEERRRMQGEKRTAALDATERITATCATLAAKDTIPMFCASGRKLQSEFKRNNQLADLTQLPLVERAPKVRDFFRRAGVNGPVKINVRESLQNNGNSGKGGFLASDSACAAGTVLGLLLPSTMRIDEPSRCMGEPWKNGVKRECGQLLGGLFNTKMQANDQEINAVIYNIGPTNTTKVHLAAVISTQEIQPGAEIVVQYDNKQNKQ